jgi:hypothetical protein
MTGQTYSVILCNIQAAEPSTFKDFLLYLDYLKTEKNADIEMIVCSQNASQELWILQQKEIRRYPLQIVQLSTVVPWDQEVFSGLSRSNGDIVLVLDMGNEESLLKIMMALVSELSDARIDLVTIVSNVGFLTKLRHSKNLFKRYLIRSNGKRIHSFVSREFAIGRGALNLLLKNSINSNTFADLILQRGINQREINLPLSSNIYTIPRKNYFSILVRYTDVPQKILKYIYRFTFSISMLISFNAVKLRLTGQDVFSRNQEIPPGWTSIILILGFGFSITTFCFYLVLKSTAELARDFAQKPHHIIKSIVRY